MATWLDVIAKNESLGSLFLFIFFCLSVFIPSINERCFLQLKFLFPVTGTNTDLKPGGCCVWVFGLHGDWCWQLESKNLRNHLILQLCESVQQMLVSYCIRCTFLAVFRLHGNTSWISKQKERKVKDKKTLWIKMTWLKCKNAFFSRTEVFSRRLLKAPPGGLVVGYTVASLLQRKQGRRNKGGSCREECGLRGGFNRDAGLLHVRKVLEKCILRGKDESCGKTPGYQISCCLWRTRAGSHQTLEEITCKYLHHNHMKTNPHLWIMDAPSLLWSSLQMVPTPLPFLQ